MPPPADKGHISPTKGPNGYSSKTSTASHPQGPAATPTNKVGQSLGSCTPRGGNPRASKMGNGASGNQAGLLTIDGETYDMAKLKAVLPDLRSQVQEKNRRITQLSQELAEKDRLLRERNEEVRDR